MSRARDDPGQRIRRALEPWLASEATLLLAVSGGPDSTALMQAAAACRPNALFVATVDHGLRPESADEARAVARSADALGLPHTTLRWEDAHPTRAIQAKARAARYRLLAAHAAAVGATAVLTGHTRDDQAETVLMRLLAGSGPAGLAGMRAERPLVPGIVLARPFLGIAKADLVAWCEAQGIAFIRDPSNADERHGRVRLRRLLPLLAREGLTPDRLVTLAERVARDDAALWDASAAAFAKSALFGTSMCERGSPLPWGEGQGEGRDLSGTVSSLTPTLSRPGEGAATRLEEATCVHSGRIGTPTAPAPLHLDGPTLVGLPDAIALRVVDRALDRAGGTLPRRLERLERLVLEDLLPALRAGRAVRRTLRGLLIGADATGRVTIRPAPPRRADSLAAGSPDLLGKGEGSAYIGSACADEPAAAGSRPTRPRD